MKEVIKRINNLIDSAISALDPDLLEYPQSAIYEERITEFTNENDYISIATAGLGKIQNVFSEVYGHENVKYILNMAIRSDKAVHCHSYMLK